MYLYITMVERYITYIICLDNIMSFLLSTIFYSRLWAGCLWLGFQPALLVKVVSVTV